MTDAQGDGTAMLVTLVAGGVGGFCLGVLVGVML